MATLRVGLPSAYSATKQKAVEEARTVQASVAKECAAAGQEPPPYELCELIGKGSFGRVYRATSVASRQVVAVKVISIDDGDSVRPGASDTFNDILKEVNTVKLLSESGARNINTVVDTRLVGHSIWIVTEYCAGGSVSTLMRPTGGLAEKWIIPILREVAEAIYWVHKQGIIHRDIKCANVLLTAAGGVQLCDFGVAGIIETKFDKRSTVTGTLHWMAPELFDSTVSYGAEVDIWAFGSMAYEMATGLPPNAGPIVDISQFGAYLKEHGPRLTGDQFSSQLKDLVGFCMVEDPTLRPPIEAVQRHPYIHDTSDDYPTASLSTLVNAYRVWEIQGGSRRSLFSAGGAPEPTQDDPLPTLFMNDEWNFSAADQDMDVDDSDAQDVYDAYGSDVDLPPRSDKWQPRRRRPPNIKALKVPLEKVFEPHTISNYDENARVFYSKVGEPSTADLPLRNNSEQPSIRESLIDLDMSLDGGNLSQFVDLDHTIKAGPGPATRSGLGGLARRRTQDWTFPSMTPASATPEPTTQPKPYHDHDESAISSRAPSPTHPGFTQDSGPLMSQITPSIHVNRSSAVSLIDLDAVLAPDMADPPRPSTADSDCGSTSSDWGKAPFDLERHTFKDPFVSSTREPSIYVSDEAYPGGGPQASRASSTSLRQRTVQRPDNEGLPVPLAWPAPLPPSSSVMLGLSYAEETREELRRLVSGLQEHLQLTSHVLEILPVHAKEQIGSNHPANSPD